MEDHSTLQPIWEQAARDIGLTDLAYALKYLTCYGYMQGEPTPESVWTAATDFQGRFGMPSPSGCIDRQTVKAMLLPRCGLPDHPMMAAEARWRKKSLAWWVERYVGGMEVSRAETILTLALDQWAAVADIRFARQAVKAQADLVMSTGQGRADGFDGPSGVLAWAELPPGDDRQLLMRFDVDETWLESPTARGILLLNVACHEFGHLLGLDHSRVSTALMAPYYSASITKPQANDDVPRIQALYGASTNPIPPSPPVPAPGETDWMTVKFSGRVDALSVPGWRCTKK